MSIKPPFLPNKKPFTAGGFSQNGGTQSSIWAVKKKTAILTLCAHKGLSRILSFYFRGHNGGFRAIHSTTTSFADLSRWKEKACSHMRKIKSGIGMHWQCVCPPSLHTPHPPTWGGGTEYKEEDREKEERKHRFSPQKCGLRHRDFEGGLVDLDHCNFRGPFADLSRRFWVFFGKFGFPHRKLQSYTSISVWSLLFQSFTNRRPECHEEKTEMSFCDLSRSNFTFAIFREPAFPFRKSAVGQTPLLKHIKTIYWGLFRDSFTDGIFPNKNHPAMGVPLCLPGNPIWSRLQVAGWRMQRAARWRGISPAHPGPGFRSDRGPDDHGQDSGSEKKPHLFEKNWSWVGIDDIWWQMVINVIDDIWWAMMRYLSQSPWRFLLLPPGWRSLAMSWLWKIPIELDGFFPAINLHGSEGDFQVCHCSWAPKNDCHLRLRTCAPQSEDPSLRCSSLKPAKPGSKAQKDAVSYVGNLDFLCGKNRENIIELPSWLDTLQDFRIFFGGC